MCGRYLLKITFPAEQYFRVRWDWQSSYNIAPTAAVPIVRLDDDGQREGAIVRWGLVPFFAKAKIGKYATHNARIETFTSNASYLRRRADSMSGSYPTAEVRSSRTS